MMRRMRMMMRPRRMTLPRVLAVCVAITTFTILYFCCDWTKEAPTRISGNDDDLSFIRRRSGGQGSKNKGHRQRSRPLDVERVAEYCNIPTDLVEGEEGEVSEDDYNLLSVYVMLRHGDRMPLASSLLDVPPPSPHNGCNMDAPAAAALLNKVPELRQFVRDMERQKDRPSRSTDFSHWALFPQHQDCGSSQLTGQGAAQQLINGLSLRRKYTQRWGLLSPDTFIPRMHLAVHSTVISRTYQSAMAFVYALLQPPPQQQQQQQQRQQPPSPMPLSSNDDDDDSPMTFDLTQIPVYPASNVMFCRSSLVPAVCCLSLSKLRQEVDRKARVPRDTDVQWHAVIPTLARVFGVKVGKLPGATRLLDFFQAHACHGIPLPCRPGGDDGDDDDDDGDDDDGDEGRCVTPRMMRDLWALVDASGNRTAREATFDLYARTIMHSLLMELTRTMQGRARNKSQVKVTVYSGHDLTMTPMLHVLGLYDGRWPGYATRLVFELYRRRSEPSKHFLRVLLNGRDVTPRVRFCKGWGWLEEVGGLCPLKRFEHFVNIENMQVIGVKDRKSLENFCRSQVL